MDYLSSLGKSQTAAVKRDADIGVAQANRDAGIKVRFDMIGSDYHIISSWHIFTCFY